MGIYSRDYIRHDERGAFARGDVSVLPWIIGICAVVFLLDRAMQGRLNDLLSLDFEDFGPRFQLWRIVTYGFCHASTGHIFFNMFALWIFGRRVESIHGPREFLAFYLVAIVLSGLGFLAIDAGLTPLVPRSFQPQLGAVGASGGVMAVTILAAMHYPRDRILFMMVIPMELRVLAVITVLLDLLGAFEGGTNIAHGAHLAGAAFGYFYYRQDWRVLQWMPRLRLPRLRRRPAGVKLYRPAEERGPERETERVSSETMDALLRKIHEQGEASLTDAERATLAEASRQLARRRQQQP